MGHPHTYMTYRFRFFICSSIGCFCACFVFTTTKTVSLFAHMDAWL